MQDTKLDRELHESDIPVLDRIVEQEGKCLELNMCQKCPFRSGCHSSILRGFKTSFGPDQRKAAALDALFNMSIMDDHELPSTQG